MQEIWAQSLGQEDPLEEEMATHSSVLVWKTQWTEEPVDCGPWGHKELDTIEGLSTGICARELQKGVDTSWPGLLEAVFRSVISNKEPKVLLKSVGSTGIILYVDH